MSVARRPLSRHRRMNLQHAVQHLLNVCLARLHKNKPAAGTRGLTPTWLISTSSLPVRSEPRAKRTCLFALVDVQLGVLVLKRASAVRTIEISFIFTCTNKLGYINYRFFPEKGGVRINRVYEKFYGSFAFILAETMQSSQLKCA